MAMQSLCIRLGKRPIWAGSVVVLAALVALGGSLGRTSPQGSEVQTATYPAWESPRLFAFPSNWGAVPAVTIRTIYPAQASWQFVTSPEHLGSSSVIAGTPCAACHGNPVVGARSVAGWAGPPVDHKRGSGCQACHGILHQRVERLGEKLVAQGPLEPDPIAGKRPYVDVEVRAAYDSAYLYMRLVWTAQRPGITHDLLRWDGNRWMKWSGPKPDALKQGVLPSYEDRLAMLIDDRNLAASDGARVGFAQAGCWITCHTSLRKMPQEPSTEGVKASPYLGGVLKKQEVQKYLLTTRSQTDPAGGWNTLKRQDELARQFAHGDFLDMLMWRAARSGPIGYADDGYVLEYRLGDKGQGPFITQEKPAYMYDQAKVGFHAVPEARFEALLGSFPLVKDDTAVPFDPNAVFKVGDILSRQVLRTPTESAADVLAHSRWEHGQWTLELRRKLNTGNPDDKVFDSGKVYYLGLAIFDDMVSNRRHHVSFPVTLGLGVAADIVAVPLRGSR